MTAFLKIDRCQVCGREHPWEWISPLTLAGRQLAGTGVWRSSLVDGLCTTCAERREQERRERLRRDILRDRFVRAVGGPQPYREYTFDRYRVTPLNRLAFTVAQHFDPASENLYLWGRCGVGKTHLAVALLRRWCGRGLSIVVTTPAQLVRRLRMRSPADEQGAVDRLVGVDLLLVDDLGLGADSAYSRQVLQEILDGRHFNDRHGLVVTSQYALDQLARRWSDGAIPSRLAGMCRVVEARGPDQRQIKVSAHA